MANLFSRLEGEVIQRQGEAGWTLIDRDAAPVLHEGRLWGRMEAFQKNEVACYRKDVIVYLLKQFQSGFQIVQIVEQLRKLPWMQGPVNKDVVKEDMQKLSAEGRVRHRGNSRKWEASPDRD